MKERIKMSVGAFLVTIIVVGAIAGLMAVDLSTDRYMPGQLATLFLIDKVDSEGAEISWMGDSYNVDASALASHREEILALRWILPSEIRFAGGIAVRLMELWEETRI